MKEYRLSKDTTEHYTSLEELRVAWGKEPFKKRTKNEELLNKQRENFCKKHKCLGCKQPMTWIGGNIMTCTNPNCKGVPVERTDKDGNNTVRYFAAYDLLDNVGEEIANNIF